LTITIYKKKIDINLGIDLSGQNMVARPCLFKHLNASTAKQGVSTMYSIRIQIALRNGKIWLVDSPSFADLIEAGTWLETYTNDPANKGRIKFQTLYTSPIDGKTYNFTYGDE
jgi:hypothetical protein